MEQTYEEILKRMSDKFTKLAGYEADRASDIGIRLKVLAGEVYSLNNTLEFIKKQMFPTTATGKYLDMHARMHGLERIPAKPATGKIMFRVEQALQYDYVIPKGTICSVRDGSKKYITDSEIVLKQSELLVIASAHSQEGGKKYNVPTNAINCPITYFSEIIRPQNVLPFTGGEDEESDESLRKRILDSFKNVSNGTNSAYYKRLAEGVSGVASAGVIPRKRGVGTVDIYITPEKSTNSSAILSEVKALVDKERELNVSAAVSLASSLSVPVSVSVKPCDGFSSDTVTGNVRNAINDYFSHLSVGESVLLSELGDVIFHTDGVYNYTFNTSVTKDTVPTQSQICSAGTITVNEI